MASGLEIALALLVLIGLWGVFRKAGQPGWAAFVPIYAELTLLRVIGVPWWWVLLIPCVGVLVEVAMTAHLSGRFGRGVGTFLGLVFLPFVFTPMLGYGPARYHRRG